MTDHPSALVSVPEADWQHVIGALKNAQARLPLGAAIGNVSDALAKVEHLKAAPAAPQAAGVGELDWSRFKEMCEQKLATALKADFGDAPFPMDANEAASYHRTRADLLGWVLDMWPTTPLCLRAPSREPEGGAVLQAFADDRLDAARAAIAKATAGETRNAEPIQSEGAR